MGNPLVTQGTLNRLRGSVQFTDYPGLNVTASFLGREAISLALEGDASMLIPTLTGGITSPQPYQMCNVTINLLKSQFLADSFKNQIELDTSIGDIAVIADSAALGNYYLANCTLLGVRDVVFDGNNPGYVVRIHGIYYINAAMWNQTG